MLYFQGLRTRTFGIAEHMKLRHIQPLNEAVCLFKILFRLPTRAYNHVHSDKRVGHHFLYLLHLRSNSAVSYRLRISFSTSSLPDCNGMWK